MINHCKYLRNHKKSLTKKINLSSLLSFVVSLCINTWGLLALIGRAKERLPKAVYAALLLVSFPMANTVSAETFTGVQGNQCVYYAREQTGFNYTTSPALGSCTYVIPDPCGAWRIYDIWNYGFGEGNTPMPNSLLVLAHWSGNPYGHVGIVQSVEDVGGGIFELRVNESNWYIDQQITEQITTNVRYRYDKNQMTTQREFTPLGSRTGTQNSPLGSTHYPVRGFVYTAAAPGAQFPLKAPWIGKAKISQGNHASYSHNECGKRNLDNTNCAWENTFAIDVSLPVGSDILAPADGKVSYIDTNPSGSGGIEVAIEHAIMNGVKFKTVYLHLNEIIVKSDQQVKQGDIIAKSGASSGGYMSGIVSPHLHFHIYKGTGLSLDAHTAPFECLIMKEVGVDNNFVCYGSSGKSLDDDNNIR